MAEKRCGLGFSCASMMQQLDLRVEDCPNLGVCGVAQRLEPDVEFELICAGSSGVVPISTTRRAAAVMMLMHRGCPQPLEAFGLAAQIAAITAELSQLSDEIAQYDGHYIAPAEVEAVAYSVKRPGPVVKTPEGMVHLPRVYWYNKLMSQTAIFAPAEKERPVKVIHLSKKRRSSQPRRTPGPRTTQSTEPDCHAATNSRECDRQGPRTHRRAALR